MTLILTIATANKIVQASDRRLTWPDGRVEDDEANKAICISCQDAHFSIAYTGLAEIELGKKRTDIWLVERLTDMQAGQMSLTVFAKSVNQLLSDTFKQLPFDKQLKRLTLVLAGYRNNVPFIGTISNQQDGDFRVLTEPNDTFSDRYIYPAMEIKPKLWVLSQSHGANAAVGKPIMQRIDGLRRKRFFQLRERDVVANELVLLIRSATRTPRFGQVIGRSCMSVAFTPNPVDGSLTQYHPRKVTPQTYMPHLIQPNVTFQSIELWSGNEPPPWWPRQPADS